MLNFSGDERGEDILFPQFIMVTSVDHVCCDCACGDCGQQSTFPASCFLHADNMELLLAFIFSIFLSLSEAQIVLNTNNAIHRVDEDFLSVTIDIGAVQTNFTSINLISDNVVILARALSPILVRVGGTSGDFVIFDDLDNNDIRSVGRGEFLLTPSIFDTLMWFVNACGWRLIFGLNQLLRYPNNEWDWTNAESLIDHCMKKGYNVAWELGNEPDCYLEDSFNPVLNGSQGAAGIHTLRQLISKKGYPVTLLAGPDVAVLDRVDYLPQYLSAMQDDTINATTWHHYYENGATASIDDFYNIDVLDSLIKDLNQLLDICNTTGYKGDLWIGETSSTYHGGSTLFSSTFLSGFMWLDKLGLAAYSQKKLFRQDLIGARYSLIDRSGYPYPDYWLSLLHKRLVGTTVISVDGALKPGRGIRVYAHCAKPPYPSGSVVLLILNVYNETAKVELENKELQASSQDIYWLTPNPRTNITSRVVSLNGEALYVKADSTVPVLLPTTSSPAKWVMVDYMSFGFIVFKEANIVACK